MVFGLWSAFHPSVIDSMTPVDPTKLVNKMQGIRKTRLKIQKASRKQNRPAKKNGKVIRHTAKDRKIKKPRTRNRHHHGIGRET